jgi:hypothetical protein
VSDREEPEQVAVGDVQRSLTTPRSLVDLLNRVLDRGVVLGGDVTLSVAGVDLVFLRLSALLTSVATARERLQALPPAPERARESHESQGVAAALPSLAQKFDPIPEPPPPAARSEPPPPSASTRSSGEKPVDLPDAIATEIARVADGFPERVDIDPDAVQRDLARLVLTIVELLRRVVEHQAVRRMDDPSLTDAQIERMGLALDRLDQQMKEMKRIFGLADEELNIDLGDLGTLL